jgi:hypothetical protein
MTYEPICDDGDFVTYAIGSPSDSVWLVPGTRWDEDFDFETNTWKED